MKIQKLNESLIDDLNGLPQEPGEKYNKSSIYDLVKEYQNILKQYSIGTVLTHNIDAGTEKFTKIEEGEYGFWEHLRMPWGVSQKTSEFDVARWLACRANITRGKIIQEKLNNMKIQKLNESNDSKYITDEIASKTNSQEIKDAIDKNNLSVLVRDNTWYTEKCPNGLGKALKDEMKRLYPDLKHMYGESKSINEDINDSDEVHTFKRDINLASDADEIQQLIYELSDGVAEDNAQQAFNENENNDLKTLKDAIITAIDVYLEDNEWLGESKSINEDALDDSGVATACISTLSERMPNSKFYIDSTRFILGKDLPDYSDTDEIIKYSQFTDENNVRATNNYKIIDRTRTDESKSIKTFGAKGKKLNEESLSESVNATFKVGDTFEFSGLYGGNYTSKVIAIHPADDSEYEKNTLECETRWTNEDTGKQEVDTDNFEITTDNQGNECIVVWEYASEKGYVYPPSAQHKTNSTETSIEDKVKQDAKEMHEMGVHFDSYEEFASFMKQNNEIPTKELYQLYVDTLHDIHNGKDKVSESTSIGSQLGRTLSRTRNRRSEASERFVKRINETSKYEPDLAEITALADDCGENIFRVSSRDIRFRFMDDRKAIKFMDELRAMQIPFNEMPTGVISVNKGDALNEASYGGAFDIEDSQFFTREDIDNFAEEVLNHINETFEEQFDISGAYITDGVIELEITNETLGDFSCNKAIDMRKVKEPWHLKRAYATDCAVDLINQIKEVSDMFESINESTTENAHSIEAGAKFGIASIINSLIVSEYAAIEEYNSAIATAQSEGFDNIVKVLTDIQAEENVHVGQLQELMKLVDPNAVKVEEGKSEGAEQLSDTFNDDDDVFDFFTSDDVEIGNEDDIDDDEVETFIKKVKESMEQKSVENSIDIDELEEEVIIESTEPWEDIYKSFKDIETQLKGDGEAITATIDKLYQDNKHNPDFKKAYDKWASNE